MDQEKITINVTPVDLGKIDVLVSQGLYSTRADLIRASIRRLLDAHDDIVEREVTRRAFVIGAQSYSREDLERYREEGERVRVRVVGLLRIANDVEPALAGAVFERITVHGVVRAPKEVVASLADRLEHGRK